MSHLVHAMRARRVAGEPPIPARVEGRLQGREGEGQA